MIITPQISLQKTPFILRLVALFSQLTFILPTLTLFYIHKGLTLGDFFMIQGIFAIFILFIEIPTGYLGDVFSRKQIIFLGSVFYTIGNAIWFFLKGFEFILLGEIMLAVSSALYSGTVQAYLFDILKKQNREQDIIKEQGMIKTFSTFGTFFATITGSVIFKHYGPDVTQFITLLITAVTPFLICILPEIPEFRRKKEKGKSSFQDIIEISKYAINHQEIKWLMLFPAAVSSITLILFWSLQPLMSLQNISITFFGIFIGINQGFRMLFSYSSDYFFKKLKTKNFSLSLLILLTISSIIAIYLPLEKNINTVFIMLGIIAIAAGSQSGLKVVTISMINSRIESTQRATILSVESMICSIFTGTTMLLSKFFIDCLGLQYMLAIILPILIIITILSLKKLLNLKL